MSEREKPHVSQEDKEVTFRPSVEKSDTDSVEFSTAPTMVTQGDLQDVIDEWKVKFHQLSEGMRAIQTASEQFGDHMENSRRITVRAKEPRSAEFRRCNRASCVSSRNVTPRTSQRRALSTRHARPWSARPSRHRESRPDIARMFTSRLPSNRPRATQTRNSTDVPHMRTTMEIAETTSAHRFAPSTAELTIRRCGHPQAVRYPSSMVLCPRNSARGSFSLRPSRATNAGHWEREWCA